MLSILLTFQHSTKIYSFLYLYFIECTHATPASELDIYRKVTDLLFNYLEKTCSHPYLYSELFIRNSHYAYIFVDNYKKIVN